jgi:NAD(P)H-hydrate epimerase
VIRGVGIDLVDVDRFRRTLARRPGLIERLFTPSERAYCLERNDPTERFAVRFAAKEATLKSMGVGIGAVEWHDIEVGRSPEGRPSLDLSGRAATLAGELGIVRFELSMTHTSTMAQAEVIAIGEGIPARRGQARMAQWRGEVGERPPLDALGAGELIGGELIPIVTPAEMNDIDREAPEPVEELIARAGSALARHAIRMLGGTYGRRVVVLVGKGNNGNDGRDAARRLTRRGVRVRIVDVANAPAVLPSCDLVIDAAFGSGFRADDSRPFVAPLAPAGALVLAVDIPSGVDGLTGQAGTAGVMTADETITFAALKPGLLFADGSRSVGRIIVADIGLDVSRASAHLLGATAVAGWLTERSPDAHKWNSAVCVVAGGPGMEGAAALVSRAALRAGAGYVRLSVPTPDPAVTPAGTAAVQLPIEVVRRRLPPVDWARDVLADLERFRSLIIGNGLGLAPATSESTIAVLVGARALGIPVVVDADGLTALATAIGGTLEPGQPVSGNAVSGNAVSGLGFADILGPNTVLTPHDGEFARLDGSPPGPDRIAAARRLAERTGAVVLLKGPSTVIASPAGDVLVSTTGDARLATAGTGDVLAGIIGALLAAGLDPFRAAAAGAFIHGRAGALGWRYGTVAGDLPWRIPAVRAALDELLF